MYMCICTCTLSLTHTLHFCFVFGLFVFKGVVSTPWQAGKLLQLRSYMLREEVPPLFFTQSRNCQPPSSHPSLSTLSSVSRQEKNLMKDHSSTIWDCVCTLTISTSTVLKFWWPQFKKLRDAFWRKERKY